ncbi:MAG: acyl-CoA thioesterase [Alphaproteobacteria bacterium]|nr:acyl-CoA thioesterase [Alphaproteobacteria bacterium]
MTETQFRTRYPFWTTVTLRFSDQDSTNHINNVAFAAYIEAGRVAFGWEHTRPLLEPRQDLFMANLSIAYRNQVRYPGNVEVGTGIKKLGRTSITLGHAIHRDDGVLAAEAESVIVLVDRAAGKSEPIPDAIRAVLGAGALAVKA